ncbi:MAG: hypothetical protein V3S55_15565 [Nitrospiraceae bacterium]
MNQMVTDNVTARKLAALAGIRHMGTIAEGARQARRCTDTVRNWRTEDDEFDAGVRTALQDFRDSLGEEITRRGRDGWEEPVVHQGRLCYRLNIDGSLMLDDDFEPVFLTVKKHSDRLLELQAKAYDERYRDKASLEVTGKDGGAVESAITVKFIRPGEQTDPPEAQEDGHELD